MTFQMHEVSEQQGRVAVVTGANSGLGFETARQLAATGMTVIMACRDTVRAEAARASILAESPASEVEVIPVNLANLQSIRGFAEELSSQVQRLDLLINNAGVMMTPHLFTDDDFEMQIGVNFLGHFLLTGLLLPQLQATAGSRIVSVASLAHRHGRIRLDDLHGRKRYRRWDAYAQSKLACLIFAYELQRRVHNAGYQTVSVAAHPGVAVSELARHFVPGVLLKNVAPKVIQIAGQSAEQGAQPILYAALGDDIEGGDYTGPVSLSEWRGRPGRVNSSNLSKNLQLASDLWQLAEELTGIHYPADLH